MLLLSGVHTAHDIGRLNDTGRCRPMSCAVWTPL